MRSKVEIEQEYAQAAAGLGQEEYLKSLAEEQIEKHVYNAGKLKNKMQALAKEAAKLLEAQDAPKIPEVSNSSEAMKEVLNEKDS